MSRAELRGGGLVASLCAIGMAWFVGCSDDVQGSVRLLLVPPHEGRNPTADPFELVRTVDVGLLSGVGEAQPLGSAAPRGRFGPGLVSGGRGGFPYVLGVNDRDRPVSAGYGHWTDLQSGQDQLLSLGFSPVGMAQAIRISGGERDSEDPFGVRAPMLRLDSADVEKGALEGDGDLLALAWGLWVDGELLLRVRVRDNQVVPAPDGQPLTEGDAVRFFLDAEGDGRMDGAQDVVVTVGAQGLVDPASVGDAQVETLETGYQVVLVLPLPDLRKNHACGLDVRVTDVDAAGETATFVTWQFDPRQAGAEPAPEVFGRVGLGMPVLDLLGEQSPGAGFEGSDGEVALTGSWDLNGLHLEASVPDVEVKTASEDPELAGSDRLELWIDLANGLPPIAEPVRLFRFTVSAGGGEVHASGADPGSLVSGGFVFTGQATAATTQDGYAVAITVPWDDLGFDGEVQRGWFLGLDVRVIDEDAEGVAETSWSDTESPDPGRWPEVRLFSLE